MSREPKRSTLWSIAEQHLPQGWRLIERTPGDDGRYYDKESRTRLYGVACFDDKTIECVCIDNRYALGVLLHECGHVRMGHANPTHSTAQDEYEAETYAIRAMRAAGLRVPRQYIDDARRYIRAHVEHEADLDHEPDLLRFAYGRNWRSRPD